MKEVFINKVVMKNFFTAIALALLLLILARYTLLPTLCENDCPQVVNFNGFAIAANILEGLIITLVVTVAISGGLLFLVPPSEISRLQALPKEQVTDQLKAAMVKTSEWRFKGNTGSFLRKVTLPDLAARARASGKSINVYVEVLDPSAIEICEQFADYRRSIAKNHADKEKWNLKYVQTGACATILMAAAYKYSDPLVEISLGLTNRMSTFRYDISSTSAIVTNESSATSAIMVNVNSHFYNRFYEESRISLVQSKLVPLDGSQQLEIAKLTVEKARIELSKLLGSSTILVEDDFVKEVIDLVQNPTSPYS